LTSANAKRKFNASASRPSSLCHGTRRSPFYHGEIKCVRREEKERERKRERERERDDAKRKLLHRYLSRHGGFYLRLA